MYLKYFGLREEPFNLTPDPKFFYDSFLHREALATLFYGIKAKKGFVVVTGEVGTGKTTLIRKLLRNLESTHHSVYIFNTLVNFDELLENITQDLGLNCVGSRVAILHKLNEFLLDKASNGHTVSLLIDEAQNLTENVLEGVRLLSNLETDREKLIQIILVGQPELEAKLNSPSLRQLKHRVSLWSRVDCLSVKDAESYIRHRLEIAGYCGPEIFDSSVSNVICEYASGSPRLINSICDNALLTAFADSKRVVSEQIVRGVVRDLRLEPKLEMIDPVRPEQLRAGHGHARPKIIRNVREVENGTRQSGERSTVERNIPEPVKADLAYNIGAKGMSDRAREFSHEHEIKRRSLSSVADNKDITKKERAGAESDEISGVRIAVSSKDVLTRSKKNEGPSGDNDLVGPAFFATMIQTLTNAMGPMASVVLKEQIIKLGESYQEFPVIRLPELIVAIKNEILSDGLRLRFQSEITKEIQEQSKPVVWQSSHR